MLDIWRVPSGTRIFGLSWDEMDLEPIGARCGGKPLERTIFRLRGAGGRAVMPNLPQDGCCGRVPPRCVCAHDPHGCRHGCHEFCCDDTRGRTPWWDYDRHLYRQGVTEAWVGWNYLGRRRSGGCGCGDGHITQMCDSPVYADEIARDKCEGIKWVLPFDGMYLNGNFCGEITCAGTVVSARRIQFYEAGAAAKWA